MRDKHDISVDTTVLGAASLLAIALGGADEAVGFPRKAPPGGGEIPPVGIWRSADGAISLDIRTDGTYAGKIAGRRRRPHGTYDLDGSRLTLRDDSGLRTPVTVVGESLEMAGHRLGRAA